MTWPCLRSCNRITGTPARLAAAWKRSEKLAGWTSPPSGSSLAQAAATAVATLEAQCADRDPWLRQKAATILLDFDAKRQEREIEERLCALEERLGLRMKERERA